MIRAGHLRHASFPLLLTLVIAFVLPPGIAAAENTAALDRALRIAASIDDDDALVALINQGANVNAANKYGKTALMNAIENGNIAAASMLISSRMSRDGVE